MKSWMLFPFILILGWILGGWLPKAELRMVREELEVARLAAKVRAPRRAGFTGVTQMLGIHGSETTPANDGKEMPHETNAPLGDALAPPPHAQDGEDQMKTVAENDAESGRSMRQGIEKAMEVWEARSDIARATFIDNAALEQEQANRFDVLMAAMNIRLAHSIEQFAEQVKSGQEASEEQTIRLVSELSTGVATAYDELDESMPPTWRQDAGEDFSVTAFVDPSVAMPLVDIEDQLDGRSFRRRR